MLFSHPLFKSETYYFFFFFFWWCLPLSPGWSAVSGSLQPSTPWFKPFSYISPTLAWITGTRHDAQIIFFVFLRWSFALVAQPGVQWHDLDSLQTPPPGSRDSPASASRVAGIIGIHHGGELIFGRDGGFTMLTRLVSNSWPQVIHLPQLPKVLGLQVWVITPSWVLKCGTSSLSLSPAAF